MTLFIAICDDESKICTILENDLIDILDKLNVTYEIDVFFSGNDLCKRMKAESLYNLIFLDIEFAQSNVSGVEVGRFIRDVSNNNFTSIVYMSWEMKYAMQLFSVRHFDFLIKPLEYKTVERVTKKYVEIAKLGVGDFTFKRGHDIYNVLIKDIVYLQSIKRKITMHLADGRKEEFYGSLKDVYQEQLRRFDFLFIHASYLVNYDFIKEAKYDKVILTWEGAHLPISQPKRTEIRKTFYDIMKKRRV